MYNIPFAIGDKVYPIYVKTESKREDCTLCDKTGTITYRGHRLVCPECHGNKSVYRKHSEWTPGQASTIQEINIRVTKISCKLRECSRGQYWGIYSFDINDVYETLDSAIDACDKRNKNQSI